MRLDMILDEIINLIKKDDYFNDIKVAKAYPCSAVPTKITKCIVAFGFDEIRLNSNQLDEGTRAGSVSIFADIFIPIKQNSTKGVEIFSRLCNVLSVYNVASVSAERLAVDRQTQTYVLKTGITFYDELLFGGGTDE